MNFRSDNEAPACPELLQAVIEANAGSAAAYGGDDWTVRLDDACSALFETDVRVLPITTGTAANCLALAQACPPWGAVFCHEEAHVQVDECGAFEFNSGGAKLLTLPGEHGRIDPADLQRRVSDLGLKGDHDPVPSALTITQATEYGTVYPLDHLADLCRVAHDAGMATHLDGARFANALVTLNCSPAEATWRAGIDMLSFALSKNGGVVGEAAIFFRPDLAETFGRRRMKGGHLVSKMRFVSAQILRAIEDDLWLRLAAAANAGARRLSAALEGHPGAHLAHPVEANEVFVHLDPELDRTLRDAGVEYHPWPGQPGLFRLVVPWSVAEQDLETIEGVLASG